MSVKGAPEGSDDHHPVKNKLMVKTGMWLMIGSSYNTVQYNMVSWYLILMDKLLGVNSIFCVFWMKLAL